MKQENINLKMFSEFKNLISSDIEKQIEKNNETISKIEKETSEEIKEESKPVSMSRQTNIDSLLKTFYNKIGFLQFNLAEKTDRNAKIIL